jgi:hypothetical protein
MSSSKLAKEVISKLYFKKVSLHKLAVTSSI